MSDSTLPGPVQLPNWLGRTVMSSGLALVLLVAGYALAIVAGLDNVRHPSLLIVLGAVCVLVHAWQVEMRSRRQTQDTRSASFAAKTAKDVAVMAKQELIVALSHTFQPITETLGRLAAASQPERKQLAASLVEKILASAADICGPRRKGLTRSVFFRLDDGRLKYETYHGRGDGPRHNELPEEACDLARSRTPKLFRNVAKDTSDPSIFAGASYKTFISAPVVAGDKVLGLLTLDAVEAGSLRMDDLRTMQVLASMLGAGLVLARTQRGA